MLVSQSVGPFVQFLRPAEEPTGGPSAMAGRPRSPTRGSALAGARRPREKMRSGRHPSAGSVKSQEEGRVHGSQVKQVIQVALQDVGVDGGTSHGGLSGWGASSTRTAEVHEVRPDLRAGRCAELRSCWVSRGLPGLVEGVGRRRSSCK